MVTHAALIRSYRYCEVLTRREAGNFYPAFCVLPRQQRLSMCALYAFMRIADDLSDEPGPVALKRAGLARWRQGLDDALGGIYEHPSHAALADTVGRYNIPREYLAAVLDGVEMDLEPVRYQTFDALRTYCYRVASAVGLACIHIWGFTHPRAKTYAEDAGLAFQMTNILRDLGEDAACARVYLPAEDLARFGYSEEKLLHGTCDDSFRALMAFEVERTRGFYDASWPLMAQLRPPGRAVFSVMAKTYRGLLEAVASRPADVFTKRVRVSKWRKLLFILQALPVRLDLF